MGRAQRLAETRRREASSVPRKMSPMSWKIIEICLMSGWSPQQISGRSAMTGVMTVSPTWIYRHIYADRAAGGSLFRCLRRRGRKRCRRGRNGSGRGVIPGRRDISERPAIVEEKTRAGDWEADTIIGVRHRGALVSLVDRATKLTLLQQVERRTSSLVRAAVIKCLQPVSDMTHTITADNGKEFAEHAEVSRALDADFYFARPYRSCDRGLNEHTNGLVREQLPKSTDFRTIDPAEVRRVQDALNNRPRRCLGYRTPAEAFREAAEAAAGG